MKILFVDDDHQEIKYFQKTFASSFDIMTEQSAEDAIITLDAHSNDVAIIVTDQRMPGKAGVDLLQYAHIHYPNIIRILTTAYCDTESAIAAINQAQIFRYIAKPWDIITLDASLSQAMQRFLLPDDNSEHILNSFREDCKHWLSYSEYAHGDSYVYRSGLEAIVHQYTRRIDQYFAVDESTQLKEQLTHIIQQTFTNESTLQRIHNSKNQGFDSITVH